MSFDVEQWLRFEWWFGHGCSGPALYGDDGEMQCNACLLDFRRAPIAELKDFVERRRFDLAALAASPPPPSVTPPVRERLEAIRRRVEAATPAPWEECGRIGSTERYRIVDLNPAGFLLAPEGVAAHGGGIDSDFAVAAREDVPFLLDLVESLLVKP